MIMPIAKKFSYTVTAATLGLALAACGTDVASTGPSFSAMDASLATASTTDMSVTTVQRLKALSSDVVASGVIGSKGGSIKVSGTGFELKVPQGAVSANTTFQVRALAGSVVAYEFEPHGARFAVPLKFSQEFKYLDLRTLPSSSTPGIGYFSSSANINHSNGTATVSELQPAIVFTDISDKKAEGNIFHFSGYLVSSGRTATTVAR